MADDSDDSCPELDRNPETLRDRVTRLRETHPDYITLGEVARLLKISVTSVTQYHSHKLERIKVDGLTLYKRSVAKAYANARAGHDKSVSRLSVKGIEVERLQRICESYYRQNMNIGAPELLALAKRIAKL